ncbi:hypothetical protein NQ317_004094 [Molorchus minor]|uniref:Peptidase aspartic putative domain-containing protein n=1 Tax=Molorchus minor TaxID=1323400 RepID=A0ABQ9JWD6_9CUCU|nr:hypothetical protein NQ317_004094 [Molorchus minor]
MEKLKKFKAYRTSALNEINVLSTLADRARTDKTVRSLFKVRCAEIDTIRDDFNKHHHSVVSTLLTDPEQDLDSEDVIREGFLSEFYKIKSVFSDLFDNDLSDPSVVNNATLHSVNQSHVRLPKIELKKFSASLHGQPLSIVRTLPLTSDNYNIAYRTLVERYSNKRLCAQAHWAEMEGTPKIDADNSMALRKLLDTFSENLAALKSLKFPTEHWDFILVMMLLKRLDNATVTRFEMEHRSSEVPSYAKLIDFLNDHCVVLDTLKMSAGPSKRFVTSVYRPNSTNNRTTALFSNKSPSSCCTFCKENHSLYTCQNFISISPAERHSFCKNLRLCFNCLSSSHDLRTCKSQSCCKKCSSRSHHTLLHFDKHGVSHSGLTAANSSSTIAEPAASAAANAATPHLHLPGPSNTNIFSGSGTLAHDTSVLLATAYIDVLDNHGTYQTLRCLLDSGSMSSFITQKAVHKLGLTTSAYSIEIKGLSSMKSSISNGRTALSFKPVQKREPIIHTDAIVLSKICDNLPGSYISPQNWTHITHLPLADPKFYSPGCIDILLGADVFSKILLNGRLSGNSRGPDAVNTIFGYVLLGNTATSHRSVISSGLCTPVEQVNTPDSLTRFFEVESVPEVKVSSPENTMCENLFAETVTRDNTGRYIVSLPFKTLRTLQQLVADEGEHFPLASDVVLNCCYIDDFIVSCPTYAHAKSLLSELIALMQRGGFELRKWLSNNPALLSDLPRSHLSHDPLTFADSTSPNDFLKVLGLRYNPTLDCFSFVVNPTPNRPCTKRYLLSELARIYDPLGFISPVTFFCKHLIQKLWLDGLGWDDTPNYEIVRERTIVLHSVPLPECVIEALLNAHSSFCTIRNILAYILRFISNLTKPSAKIVGPLTNSELRNALFILVKHTQQNNFAEELSHTRFSKPLRKLQAFLDNDGLLRVGGRLKHASLSYSAKHPILLPRQSRLTLLLIQFYHERFFHAGFRSTHFLLLQEFWILSAKRAINGVISKCIRCWKHSNPPNFQPIMGNLPAPRISQAKPFSTCSQRGKWLDVDITPTIGTLVLIKCDNLPPYKWSLGRIVALHFGDDKVARVATVRTANGSLKRPLVKLCPLPVE